MQNNRGLPTFGPQNFLSEIKPLGKNEIKRDRSDSSTKLPSISGQGANRQRSIGKSAHGYVEEVNLDSH